MATNFASEFSKVMGGGAGACSVKGKDWNEKRYFDPESSDCYKAEAALISELTSEAYGNYGLEVLYYVKNIDTKIDRLYGEDPLENIERRFKLQMYTESIPTMQKQYDLQGMIYNEIITCQCTIQHFYEASQLTYPDLEDMYEPIEPRIGDIVYMQYSDTYYEVINVKPFAEQSTFMSTPITYTFSLRIWHNNHEDVNDNIADPMNEIRHFTELAETFDLPDDPKEDKDGYIAPESDILSNNTDLKNDKDIFDEPKDNVPTHVNYADKEIKEENPQYYDPFGGW